MRYLLIALIFLSLKSEAQWKSYKLNPRRDTLNRIDMSDLKQGPWVVHVDPLRGEDGYEEEGIFIDSRKEGPWRKFSLQGDLIAIENYYYGMKSGKCQYFLNTGELAREESWRAIDPKHPYDTVTVYDVNDPSIVLRKEIVKVEPNSYKHGTWTYYNTETGTIASTENWVMNKLREDVAETSTGSEDDLAPIDVTKGGAKTKDTANKDDKKTATKPKEVMEYEKKNSGKKKIKVRDGSTGG
jgi:hypothetical protein